MGVLRAIPSPPASGTDLSASTLLPLPTLILPFAHVSSLSRTLSVATLSGYSVLAATWRFTTAARSSLDRYFLKHSGLFVPVSATQDLKNDNICEACRHSSMPSSSDRADSKPNPRRVRRWRPSSFPSPTTHSVRLLRPDTSILCMQQAQPQDAESLVKFRTTTRGNSDALKL
ncbi:hypothetical protein BD311DRAFT_269099 [Dichomitus squalens]|uniref:Uncharacterized protein n=1 Tax=Dichomitus squalens TaxID=114155 RepID=A0A4Q9MQ96_9APHY|nr:hypothetical protein BD311DRAFT_269099 [Dichomitus squalens]